MRNAVVLFLAVFSIAAAGAAPGAVRAPDEEGLYEVGQGRYLYAKVYRGNARKPAIVSINGLTQDTEHWDTNLEELLKTGRTLVFYDTEYQGRSLEAYVSRHALWSQVFLRPTLPPLTWYKSFFMGSEPLLPAISLKQHSRDLRALLDELKIKKASIAGLSFGGAVAIQYSADYPDLIEQTFAEAPYIEPQAEQDKLIRYFMTHIKRTYPLIPFDDVDLYDLIFRGLVLTTYHLAEPTILKWGPFQRFGVAELARGVRHMDGPALAQKFRPKSFNLVIAGMDSYIQREVHTRFWQAVPHEARASLAVFEGVEHKMNESVGPFLGAWIGAVLAGGNSVRDGHVWQGHPEKGLIQTVDGKVKLELPKTVPCETLLRPGSADAPGLAIDRIARDQTEIVLGWFRALMPPNMRGAYDHVLKFWGGL